MAAHEAERQTYLATWPNYCKRCLGWGGSSFPGHRGEPPDWDECPECLGQNRCPRCGATGPEDRDWWNDPEGCPSCGWTEDSGPPDHDLTAGLPQPWECRCGEREAEEAYWAEVQAADVPVVQADAAFPDVGELLETARATGYASASRPGLSVTVSVLSVPEAAYHPGDDRVVSREEGKTSYRVGHYRTNGESECYPVSRVSDAMRMACALRLAPDTERVTVETLTPVVEVRLKCTLTPDNPEASCPAR